MQTNEGREYGHLHGDDQLLEVFVFHRFLFVGKPNPNCLHFQVNFHVKNKNLETARVQCAFTFIIIRFYSCNIPSGFHFCLVWVLFFR